MFAVLFVITLASGAVPSAGLTVTGQRHAERAAEAARSVDVADRKSLDDAGHLDLAELFSSLPGVSLREVAPGAITPVIRGLMGPDNLVLIDGLRYNTSLFRRGANRQINSLGLYSFEGLSLIRGNGGVGYGSGALGGVLSLRSRDLARPDKRWWYWREFFAYPGNTRYNFTSLLKKQKGPFAIAVSAQRDKFRGRRHGGVLAGEEAVIPKADHGQWDWLLKMRYALSDWVLQFGYLGMSVKGGGEIDQLERGELRRTAPNDHFAWLRAEGRHSGWLRRSTFFIGSRRASQAIRIDRCQLDGNDQVGDRQACLDNFDLNEGDEGYAAAGLNQRLLEDETVMMHQAGVRLRSKRRGGWRVNTGAEIAIESVEASQTLAVGSGFEMPPYGTGLGYLTGGAFAQVEGDLGKVGDRALTLTGGLRLAAYAVLDNTADRARHWLAPAADLALNLRHRGRSAAWLSVSRSNRAPNLFELFYTGDTGSFYQQANADLGLQHATMVELGSKRRTGKLIYQASLFAMMVDQLLEEQLQPSLPETNKPVVRLANLEQGRFFGGDLGVQHRFGEVFTQSHQFGLVIAEIEHDGSVQASRRSAPLQGRHSLAQKWTQKWWGEVNVNWAAGLDGAGLSPLDAHDLRVCPSADKPWLSTAQAQVACDGTPAWWTTGVRVVYQRIKDRRLGLRIDNLLDRKYRTHQSAAWAKGITVRLDVEVAF